LHKAFGIAVLAIALHSRGNTWKSIEFIEGKTVSDIPKGFLFLLLCIVLNIINVWMEEGVFLIAFLFGIWHWVMPLRDYAQGNISLADSLIMYINCFWVSGSFKGHGYSNDLLNRCIDDSKAKGRLGLCILSSAKKKPFLSEPKHLLYKGFRVADTSKAGINLMYLAFDEEAAIPEFTEAARHPHIEEQGYVL